MCLESADEQIRTWIFFFKDITKYLKIGRSLSDLRAKRYEIVVFCRTQMCGGLSHPADHVNSSAVASRCPVCWTHVEKRSQRSNRWHRPCRDADAASGHGAFVNGTCCTSYISRSAECPAADHIERSVALGLSRIGGLGFPTGVSKDFSCMRYEAICGPIKKNLNFR